MAKLIERIGDTKREIKFNVPDSYIENVQEDFISQWREELVGLTVAIYRGDRKALIQAGELIKKIHLASLIKGKDGDLNAITDKDYKTMKTVLKQQLYNGKGDNGKPYGLHHLFKEVANGKVSEPMLRHRLNLYGKSGKVSASISQLNKRVKEGYKSKRRNLGNCIHCDDCLRYSRMGWVGIDSMRLPPIATACACRNNCNCTFSFSIRKRH